MSTNRPTAAAPGSNNPPDLRGLQYFAVPSSIQNRMHLVAFEFKDLEEWSQIHVWGIARGYLPALDPQEGPGMTFDNSVKRQGKVVLADSPDGGEFLEDGTPICPNHPGGMLSSKKEPGGFYCGRKGDRGTRCGWQWNEKRGFYQYATARGAARR